MPWVHQFFFVSRRRNPKRHLPYNTSDTYKKDNLKFFPWERRRKLRLSLFPKCFWKVAGGYKRVGWWYKDPLFRRYTHYSKIPIMCKIPDFHQPSTKTFVFTLFFLFLELTVESVLKKYLKKVVVRDGIKSQTKP